MSDNVVPITRNKDTKPSKPNLEHHVQQFVQQVLVHQALPGDLLCITLADRLPARDKISVQQAVTKLMSHLQCRVLVLDPGDRVDVIRRFMNATEQEHFVAAYHHAQKAKAVAELAQQQAEVLEPEDLDAEIARLQAVAAKKRAEREAAAAEAANTPDEAPPEPTAA